MRMLKPARIALATATLAIGVSLAVAGSAAATISATTPAATQAATTHPATIARVAPLNNDGATVTDPSGNEVTAVAPAICPSGDTCLYTDPNYGDNFTTGSMFELYTCGTYYLHNWTQDGSIYNNNTGGVTAYTDFSPGNTDLTIPAQSGSLDWNANPDNEVVPC